MLVLLLLTPRGGAQFWLIAAALTALIVVHLIFWVMTQPVNKYWLRQTKLTASAERFFETGRSHDSTGSPPDWTVLRDRWERSHVLRAAIAMLALILLITAVAQ